MPSMSSIQFFILFVSVPANATTITPISKERGEESVFGCDPKLKANLDLRKFI